MGITRKDFIRKSGLGIMGMNLATMISLKDKETITENNIHKSIALSGNYTLKNVLLETGFLYNAEGDVIQTKTALFNVNIANGKIISVDQNNANTELAVDMKGLLMLPSFKDMHIHLDKTYFGGPWQAKKQNVKGVKGMIEFEKELLPSITKHTEFRANEIIDLLQRNGTSFTRSHINIEPTSKLEGLKKVQKVLESRKDNFEAELVAFPSTVFFIPILFLI